MECPQFFKGRELIYYQAAALFQPPTPIYSNGGKSVSVIDITFDRLGRATSESLRSNNWIAKHSLLDRILLIDPSYPDHKPYRLGEWSQGVPGNDTFSPAICDWADDERYLDDWAPNNPAGGFGCREWTAQLYNRDQPYINVTSYGSRGPFIGDFVGWARFRDPPKPVIGLAGKVWLCLYECPAEEKPGVIRDIKAWTRKHGFPTPLRPPRQPQYPNSNYKDDLNEFSD